MIGQFGRALLPAAAMFLVACSPTSISGTQNNRVLFLLGEEFDPQEFWGPYATLRTAGYNVDLAGPAKGMELTPDSHLPEANIRTTLGLDEVDVSKYLALVVPGGPSAANIARFPTAGRIAREFNSAGKPIGAVCHGARLLMPEGIFRNRTTTAIFMVADELCDQWKSRDYGMYLDLPVVTDRNLTCSRDPRDVPVWSQGLIARFAQSGGLKAAPRQARVLIVLPGATTHQKWVLDRLSIFGLSPFVSPFGSPFGSNDARTRDTPSIADAGSYDMLVILDGPGTERLNSSKSFRSTLSSFAESKKTILVSDAARKKLPDIDLAPAKLIRPDDLGGAMRHIYESANPAGSSTNISYPDSEPWVAKYVAAAASPIKGAPWNPAIEYDAVLALWHGYDDDAAARMNDFLVRSGRKVLIVGPNAGTVTGLNGSKAEALAPYDGRIRLSKSAIVVAPGGVWPKKTKAQQAVQPQWVEAGEPARQRRLDWLTAQYQSGRMLVAIGFDSLYIGQQKRFKGMHFASTDQASVIWFGSEGAEYSPEKALFSDTNLLTAKPLVGIDDAIKLLRQSGIRPMASRFHAPRPGHSLQRNFSL